MKLSATPDPSNNIPQEIPYGSVQLQDDASQSELYHLLMQAPVAIVIVSGPNYIIELVNDLYVVLADKSRAELLHKPAYEAMPAAGQGLIEVLDNIRSTGTPNKLSEHETRIERNGQLETTYWDIVYQPIKSTTGTVDKIMILTTDMTEQVVRRKQKEQDNQLLQQVQDELNIALSIGNIGIWQWNVKHDVLKWSDAQAALYGLKPGDYPNSYQKWLSHVHPDDVARMKATGENAVEDADSSYEFRIIHADGSVRWLQAKSRLFFDESGRPDYVLGVNFDISESKRLEIALQESEAQFRNFSDNITNLAWIANGEGWIFWYNQRWYDYTGTTLAEMKGWGWEKVHHPDHIGRVVDFVKDAWHRDEPFELTFPLRRYDGEYRWFLTRAVPVKDADGNIYRWIGTNTDVHEQKLAEEKIKESETRFRTLAEALPQMVWMTDEKGVYEYASHQWNVYSGLDPYDKSTWSKMVHPDDIKLLMVRWSESLKNGTAYRAEARLKNKTGAYRWHFVQGEPIQNEEGIVKKWIGAYADIHDQKTMTENLERQVALRTRELQRSNEDLQQFAHVASHDLKEPLRKIRTFGSRLSHEFGEALPESGKIYLEKIEAAAARMYAMIDGVLHYSTVSTAEQTVEPIDLNEILHNIEADLEVVIHQKGAVVQYKDLPTVEGSSVLLNQLFYNLINNALKFSKAGAVPEIRITATSVSGADAARVWHLDQQAAYVQISMQDNGIGFSQDHAERIFKTFTRLNPKDKYEGTGLGLALCKKIVERHNGAISAAGIEGMGSVFNVVLPLQQPKKSA